MIWLGRMRNGIKQKDYLHNTLDSGQEEVARFPCAIHRIDLSFV